MNYLLISVIFLSSDSTIDTTNRVFKVNNIKQQNE